MQLLALLTALLLTPARAADDPRQALSEARAEERSVLDQLAEIDQELHAVRQQIAGLRDQEQEVEARRMRHEDELASADAVLVQHKEVVAARVEALYMLHKRGLARIVFGAEDPVDLRRRAVYLQAIIEADAARMTAFAEAVARKQEALDAIGKDKESVAALRAELLIKEGDLKAQRSRRVDLLDEIKSKKELALRAASEYDQASTGLGTRLSLSGGGDEGGEGGQQQSFRASYGKLSWPTTGQVIREFGPYLGPANQTLTNPGIDIAAGYGTPIRAVHGGTVVLAEYVKGGYGQTVVVESGPYKHVYSHCNGVKVRTGQQVEAGDVLGSVGNTGLTVDGGYQLTFEIRYNGSVQDPRPWLRSQ